MKHSATVHNIPTSELFNRLKIINFTLARTTLFIWPTGLARHKHASNSTWTQSGQALNSWNNIIWYNINIFILLFKNIPVYFYNIKYDCLYIYIQTTHTNWGITDKHLQVSTFSCIDYSNVVIVFLYIYTYMLTYYLIWFPFKLQSGFLFPKLMYMLLFNIWTVNVFNIFNHLKE